MQYWPARKKLEVSIQLMNKFVYAQTVKMDGTMDVALVSVSDAFTTNHHHHLQVPFYDPSHYETSACVLACQSYLSGSKIDHAINKLMVSNQCNLTQNK